MNAPQTLSKRKVLEAKRELAMHAMRAFAASITDGTYLKHRQALERAALEFVIAEKEAESKRCRGGWEVMGERLPGASALDDACRALRKLAADTDSDWVECTVRVDGRVVLRGEAGGFNRWIVQADLDGGDQLPSAAAYDALDGRGR